MSGSYYSYQLQAPRVRTEFFRMLPISLFVVAFGAAFGLASTQAGLSPFESILMSVTVFAGASQFGALDLWGAEVSVIPVLVVVFAINARHLLMGASLYPMLKDVSPGRRYGLLLLLTDANWAACAQDYQNGRRNLEVILGGGFVLWLAWVIGTAFGAYFSGLLQNPEAYGLDMVLGCFLLTMVLGGKKTPRVMVVWLTAGVTSYAAWRWLPANMHVVVGALAGGVIGLFWLEPRSLNSAEEGGEHGH
ncbi:AzlC family ABC transporter permease [Marinobacter sp.]|uniref:AzlC family ABC transporter permease n=1 Tax=Marinobacter sp. TaxID=50741 RepID=UPI0035637C26